MPWATVAVESIAPGDYAATMTVGTAQQLSPDILPEKAAKRANVSFVSDNPNIVSVTSDGVAQAVGLGTAHVAATVGDQSCLYTITTEPDASMVVTEMDITLASNTIAVGDTTSLSLAVLPTSAANYADVSLSSSNEGVATVNSFGKITGIAPGTATITATSGSVSASATIKVVASGSVVPQSLSLNTNYVVLKPGSSKTITGSVAPSTASQSLTFKSNDTKIATVNGSGVITDDKRIRASLETINYLLDHNAAVILCSHLGRPKGEVNMKYSLAPVAKRLSELLGKEVKLAKDVVGEDAKKLAAEVKPGEVVLLENVRFEKGETKNDAALAKAMADMADIYVNDAFGTAHRAHASTAGIADYLPAVCGFLIKKEISIMGKALSDPARPFVAILGGAKVSDKIGVIENLIDKCDTIIIGGGMAYTFSKAQGGEIGTSLCEEDKIELALGLLKKAADKGVKLLLPVDTVCADHFGADAAPVVYEAGKIPADMMGMDIGPKTVELFSEAVKDAGTVVWNGPMGVFEFDTFAVGTKAVAKAIAESKAVSIIGGGDSAAAVEKLGFADKMTHISTGGGASLEFLEGLELPGIACLQDK